MFIDTLFSNPRLYAVSVAVTVMSIVLHELGHALAAEWQGDRTPRLNGRMTFNPVVHMGWTSLALCAIVGIAWGSTPVNPRAFRHRRTGEVLVSFAGPGVNLALAAVAGVILACSDSYGARPGDMPLAVMFWAVVLSRNAVLFVFNMLPFPPLDGFDVVAPAVMDRATAANLRSGGLLGVIAAVILMNVVLSDLTYAAAGAYVSAVREVLVP